MSKADWTYQYQHAKQTPFTRPEHKFQFNEKVIIEGEVMTVSEINWAENKRMYTYTVSEYPHTFFFENELALAPSLDSNTQRSGGRKR